MRAINFLIYSIDETSNFELNSQPADSLLFIKMHETYLQIIFDLNLPLFLFCPISDLYHINQLTET